MQQRENSRGHNMNGNYFSNNYGMNARNNFDPQRSNVRFNDNPRNYNNNYNNANNRMNNRMGNYENRGNNYNDNRPNNYNRNLGNNFRPNQGFDRRPPNTDNRYGNAARVYDHPLRGRVVNGFYQSFDNRRNGYNRFNPYSPRQPSYREFGRNDTQSDGQGENIPSATFTPSAPIKESMPSAKAENFAPLNS